MELFDIAGLKIEMNCRDSGMLYDRSRAYLSDSQQGEADFRIDVPDEVLYAKQEILPQLSLDELRYVYSGEAFYHRLLDFDGMLLHASCIEKDGAAYLFSAGSGTGKSTHTHIWMKVFDGVRMINDDKPAIRRIGTEYYACGTPFSGKNDESTNVLVPIRAIVFLDRAADNSIEKMSPKQALPLFLSQTVRPLNRERTVKMLSVLDGVLKSVPIFKLRCNMSDDAAYTAYKGIEDYIHGVDIK